MGNESGKIGTPRLTQKFTDTNDRSANRSGSSDSSTIQVNPGVYLNSDYLSDRLIALQNNNKKVKINKGKNKKESRRIDILQYSSRDEYLYLNGRITAKGIVYNKLISLIKALFIAFGIKVFKNHDDVYWCRHLAFAVMKGYLKKEDIENVESKEDFVKLLDSMKDIEEIKRDLVKNKTVLDKLQKDYSNFAGDLTRSIIWSIIPVRAFDSPDTNTLISTIEKMQKYLSNITPKRNKENSILVKDKTQLKKAQTALIIIHKLSKKLEKSLRLQDEEKICNEIAKQLDTLDTLISADKTTTSKRITTSTLLSLMNNKCRNIITPPTTKTIQLCQAENTPKLAYLQKLADNFNKHGYKKEHEIITSILAGRYITKKDVNTLIYEIYNKNRFFVDEFYIKDQGERIANNAYILNHGELNSIVCSESSFSETLYYLCTEISSSSEPTEKSFLLETPNHSMELTIKSDGDKRHLVFYDPSKTTNFQEIELSVADMAQSIEIKDFLSPSLRKVYKLAGFKNILTGSLNDKLNIKLHENM